MTLETRRAKIQQELDEVSDRIARLQNALVSGSTVKPAATKSAASAPAAPAAAPAKRGRKPGRRAGSTAPHSRRGELAEKITALLRQSGSGGISVKDISEKIGVPYKNVAIWFATTGKKNKAIKKVAPARYKITG